MGCAASQPKQQSETSASRLTAKDRRKLHHRDDEEDAASRHSEAISDHESAFSTDKFFETMGRKQCRPRSAGHICPQPSKTAIKERIELTILRAELNKSEDDYFDDALSRDTVNSDKDSVEGNADQPQPVLIDFTAKDSTTSSGEVQTVPPTAIEQAQREDRAWKRRERRRNRRVNDFLSLLPLVVELPVTKYLDPLCACQCLCAVEEPTLDTSLGASSTAPTWCREHGCESQRPRHA